VRYCAPAAAPTSNSPHDAGGRSRPQARTTPTCEHQRPHPEVGFLVLMVSTGGAMGGHTVAPALSLSSSLGSTSRRRLLRTSRREGRGARVRVLIPPHPSPGPLACIPDGDKSGRGRFAGCCEVEADNLGPPVGARGEAASTCVTDGQGPLVGATEV
jgi:hypothetical protein